MSTDKKLVAVLASREEFRDQYRRRKDPIAKDRLLWRAQTVRHLTHLLPGQRILEIAAGDGLFATQLAEVTRSENPILAVTHKSSATATSGAVTFCQMETLTRFPGEQEFDVVVAIDVLDQENCLWLLQVLYKLLAAGGQLVLFETNPWNPMLRLRRSVEAILRSTDTRNLLSQPRLYELLSGVGLIRILAIYTDFVYFPLNAPMVWLLRNLSILLENMPGVQRLAGSILIYGQKPGAARDIPGPSLFRHETLRGAVSVVVPCHNEEMNVRPLVTRLMSLYGEYLHEIVLVDDNSADNTANVIRELQSELSIVRGVYRHPPNGVGRALADGYRVATGTYVLSMDCDFTNLMPELRDLFDAAADGYDVVVGSRFSRHSVLLNYPFQKIVANRAFHTLARIIFRKSFRDLTNNLKLMKCDVVQSLRLTEPHFAANAETGFQPLLMGYSVKEVPISWINRTPDMGVSSFRLAKVGGGYWSVLVRLALETRFGLRTLRRGICTRASERLETYGSS